MINKNAGYVYIISAVKTKYFKIGVTEESVVRRLRELQTACPFKLRYIYHAYVFNMFQTEKELHKTFQSFRAIGEWFTLTTEDVQKCITLMKLMQIEEVEEIPEPETVIEEKEEEVLEYLEVIEFNVEEENTFTKFNLSKEKALELILKLKYDSKHTQTQIIWMLWNAKPGVTKSYKNAVSEYKELMRDEID